MAISGKLEHSGGEKPIQVEAKEIAISVNSADLELVRQLLAGGSAICLKGLASSE